MILTFSAVDEGSKILSDFLSKCFVAKLQCFLLVSVCLHHKLFLRQLGDSAVREVRSGLHDRFTHDGVLQHYQQLMSVIGPLWCFSIQLHARGSEG